MIGTNTPKIEGPIPTPKSTIAKKVEVAKPIRCSGATFMAMVCPLDKNVPNPAPIKSAANNNIQLFTVLPINNKPIAKAINDGYITKFSPYVSIQRLTQQQELEAKLLDGEVDLGIFHTPIRHPEIACQPLLTQEIYLAVLPNHTLAHRKNSHLSEVTEEPFVSVTSDYAFGEMTKLFCR